jgi:hypothetical protein
MSPREAENTHRHIDQDFPHQVLIQSSPGNLASQILDMHEFCRELAMNYRTQTGQRKGGDFIRYCFADPVQADTFANKFGGERNTVVLHDRP